MLHNDKMELGTLVLMIDIKPKKTTLSAGVDFDAKNKIEISTLSDTFIYPVRLFFLVGQAHDHR
ncbi:hypothetical protein BB497_03020 [Halomonas sp. GFAJ-1]|nr:hypothetical protein BB497_03020 [Halomonas sp. GFAJ-1]